MFADEVSPRNILFRFVVRDGQRSHAGISVENVIGGEAGIRESKISLTEQIVDFPLFAADLIRVTFKANVRRSNQIKLVQPETKAKSVTYPYVQPLGPKAINGVGSAVPAFKNMFADLENFFGGISEKISKR